MDVPRFATLEDCLEIVKSLFSPSGESPAGNAKDMSSALGNYASDVTVTLKKVAKSAVLSRKDTKGSLDLITLDYTYQNVSTTLTMQYQNTYSLNAHHAMNIEIGYC